MYSFMADTKDQRPFYISVIRFLLLCLNTIIIPLPLVGVKWEAFVSEGIIARFVRSHECRHIKLPNTRSILSRRARRGGKLRFVFTTQRPNSTTRTYDDEGQEWDNGLSRRINDKSQ
jgi:hypothetical protein